jgi:hypothetical protein
VTLAHLQREMQLSLDVTQQHAALAPTAFIALETPHVVVAELTPENIEDVVDNLMALGVFETVFVEIKSGPTEIDRQPETSPPAVQEETS